jgi:hypothetical protein
MIPRSVFMADEPLIPWHEIRYTPEQEAEVARRLSRMHARFDMPIDLIATADGFIARRDGKAGCGLTALEAKLDLYDKENKDTVNPPFE